MAEVVVEQAGSEPVGSGGLLGGVGDIFTWLGQHWYLILLVLIFIAVIVIVIYFIFYWNKQKLRQDPMYVHYEKIYDATQNNSKGEWITKRRRWWLIVFGAPTALIAAIVYLYVFYGESWFLLFFWIGLSFLVWLIPVWFWYKDVSMRIVNVDYRTIGFYRGHARPMDGYCYILVKIGFKWIFFERKEVLRVPESVLTFRTQKKKPSKKGEKIDAQETEDVFEKIEIDSYVWNERDNYIFIPMTTYYKEGSWFQDVTLVQGKKIADLRQKIAKSYHLITQVQSAEQLYSHLGKAVNNAVDSNPHVTAQKKLPEKEKSVHSSENPT